ncbi:MAG: tetratricopeptide repeat protein [Myxococcota bacterium]
MDATIKRNLSLGHEHYKAGDYDAAETLLTAVVDTHDRFADVRNILGVIAHQKGLGAKAQRHFERALELNPHYTEAALNLSIVYNEVGRYGDAREVYAKATRGHGPHETTALEQLDLQVRGKVANLHAELGDTYRAIGQTERAAEQYVSALQFRPDFVDVRLKRAASLREIGRVSAAVDDLVMLRNERPGDIRVHLELGLCLWTSGHHAKARKEWEAALALEPDNARAKFYVAAAREQS